jgi:sugar O-acyltransferase (sialic acid O-acetyltransferase NeuD family)
MLLKSKEYKAAGIIDVKKRSRGNVFGIRVVGTDSSLPSFFKKGVKYCFIAVGSIGNPALRVKLYNIAREYGFLFPNLIHPSAIISARAALGEGNYIGPGVIINAGTKIGNNCIINTGALIEHDCVIEDFVHIAPGVILSGNVFIDKNTHVGTGSSVIQGITIGMNSVIGAGSVVVKNISSGSLAFGNPCKVKKINE